MCTYFESDSSSLSLVCPPLSPLKKYGRFPQDRLGSFGIWSSVEGQKDAMMSRIVCPQATIPPRDRKFVVSLKNTGLCRAWYTTGSFS